MAMKSGTSSRFGDKVTYTRREDWWRWNGQSWYALDAKSPTKERQTLERRTLTVGTQPKGNRRDPTPQAYQVEKFNAMSGSMTTVYYYRDASSAVRIEQGSSGPQGTFAPSKALGSDIEVRNKLLGKINEKTRGELDLSVDIAQAGQVKRMFNDVSRLETYVKGFDRKTIANKYLEFIFGWKPLAQSLVGTIGELSNSCLEAQRIKGRASQTTTKTEVFSQPASGLITTDTIETSVRVESGFWFKPTNQLLNQVARLSSLNPISIYWETVPYSFVVDYVYDIGSYLRNLETAMIYAGSYGGGYETVTKRTTTSRVVKGTGMPYGANGGYVTTGSFTGKTVVGSKVRATVLSYPLPDRPTFRVQLGSTRLLNLAALLTQLLPSPVRKVVAPKRLTTEKWQKLKRQTKRREDSYRHWSNKPL